MRKSRDCLWYHEVQAELFCMSLEAELGSSGVKTILQMQMLWNKQNKTGKKGTNFLL